MPDVLDVSYVTSSQFKREECKLFHRHGALSDGTKIRDRFRFLFYSLPIRERLEIDIEAMVKAEVLEAYGSIRVPCIVEHAGLVFEHTAGESYPGGLTKPMWNALGSKFIHETNSAGRRTIARAVVAYCDGKRVWTFVGETRGTLAPKPKGKRGFYWDTVFIPDSREGRKGSQTYAEIVERRGLRYKVEHLSQSTKSLRSFVEFLHAHPSPKLWVP